MRVSSQKIFWSDVARLCSTTRRHGPLLRSPARLTEPHSLTSLPLQLTLISTSSPPKHLFAIKYFIFKATLSNHHGANTPLPQDHEILSPRNAHLPRQPRTSPDLAAQSTRPCPAPSHRECPTTGITQTPRGEGARPVQKEEQEAEHQRRSRRRWAINIIHSCYTYTRNQSF